MRRFLLIIATLALCAGCQYLDKEIDQQPDNGVVDNEQETEQETETELEVDKSELVLDYTAQSVEIEVTANKPFEVSVNVSWITYTTTESGDRVVLSVAENTTSKSRSAKVVITADELSHTVIVEQGAKPEQMQLLLEHTSSVLDTPTWGGSNVKGVIDWGDGTTEEYSEGVSHEYADSQKHSALFMMEGATSFHIERIGEIESVTISL